MADKHTGPVDVIERGLWSSRLMFILAAAGSAIGLGNIWRFPFLVGRYGGGAFVLMYLACILLIGMPILVAEIMIGRESRKNPVGAFRRLSGGNRWWTAVGFLGVASGFVILSYYSVIAGWTLDYFAKSVSGDYMGADWEGIRDLFGALAGDGVRQVVWHSVFMGATIAIVIFGVKEGLERWIGILMPLLFLLLLALVVYGLVSGDAGRGLSYLFSPDFTKLYTNEAGEYTVMPVLEAMGQAFFTLSLGMGAMITYGSYLGDDESIPGSALMVAFLDTLIAILAGIAIYTLLFKYNLDPAQGPGLVFKVLPLVFAQMPGGRVVAILFFMLLAFAALTSAISLLEVVVAYFIDDKKWNRRAATLAMGGVIWGLGVFSALSYNRLSGVTLLRDMEGQGMAILDSIDRVANNYMLPVGGLFIALFAGWFMKREAARRQLLEGGGSPALLAGWSAITRYVAPALLAAVFLFMIDSQFRTGTGLDACDLARSGAATKLERALGQDPQAALARTEAGLTPLHYAARYGHLGAAQTLIKAGAPVNAGSSSGETPLLAAAGKAGPPMVDALIQAGADVRMADARSLTPLHLAAREGNFEVMKILIEAGAEINARDHEGNTPLHLAAGHGYKTAVRILLENGADRSIRNQEGLKPSDLPSLKAHGAVAELLRD